MKVTIWSETSLYGGAIFLAKGMKKFCNTSLCVLNKEPYKYGPEDVEIIYWRNDRQRIKALIESCDVLVVSATISLRYLMEIVGFKKAASKPIVVLVGDSHYCNNCNKFVKPLLGRVGGGFNSLFQELEANVFMMPDKYHFCDGGVELKPYFPPTEIPDNYIFPKHKRVTVLHLPGSARKQYEKGTSEILDVFERIKAERSDVDFNTPAPMDWKTCIKLKSQCHIYIDQLVKGNANAGIWRYKNTSGIIYEGGLGKAGIESMYVGTLTMASGNDIDILPYFPKPPVVWVDKVTFERTLREMLSVGALNRFLQQQVEWARTYTAPEYVAKYILSNVV